MNKYTGGLHPLYMPCLPEKYRFYFDKNTRFPTASPLITGAKIASQNLARRSIDSFLRIAP